MGGYNPLENFGHGFEENNDSEEGRAVVGGLTWFIKHHAIGPFQGSRVMAIAQERVDKVGEECRARVVNLLPYPGGDGVRPGRRVARGVGEGL